MPLLQGDTQSEQIDSSVWLPKSSTYAELVAIIAEGVGVRAEHLQLYKHTLPWGAAVPIYLEGLVNGTTVTTLLQAVAKPVVLLYEALEMSLEEAGKLTEVTSRICLRGLLSW